MIFIFILILLIFAFKMGSAEPAKKEMQLFDFFNKSTSQPGELFNRDLFIIGHILEKNNQIRDEIRKKYKNVIIGDFKDFKDLEALRRWILTKKNVPVLLFGDNNLGGRFIVVPNYVAATYEHHVYMDESPMYILRSLDFFIKNAMWKIKNRSPIMFIYAPRGAPDLDLGIKTDDIIVEAAKRRINSTDCARILLNSGKHSIFIGSLAAAFYGLADYLYFYYVDNYDLYRNMQKNYIDLICANKGEIFKMLDKLNKDNAGYTFDDVMFRKIGIRDTVLEDPEKFARQNETLKYICYTYGYAYKQFPFNSCLTFSIIGKTTDVGAFAVAGPNTRIFDYQKLPAALRDGNVRDLYNGGDLMAAMMRLCIVRYGTPDPKFGHQMREQIIDRHKKPLAHMMAEIIFKKLNMRNTFIDAPINNLEARAAEELAGDCFISVGDALIFLTKYEALLSNKERAIYGTPQGKNFCCGGGYALVNFNCKLPNERLLCGKFSQKK